MRLLGQDSWKISAALMGSYIGGAVNTLPFPKRSAFHRRFSPPVWPPTTSSRPCTS
uniref:Uncharacterized protein n=1 Tax=Arundo donax TaxID=35708 RepID=A0A0A8YBX0_ARUDO